VYDVSKAYSSCPSVTDPLGFPPDASDPSPRNIFNDIQGLKDAIHVDPSHTWCVFLRRASAGLRGLQL
jgi:hypothetical protein